MIVPMMPFATDRNLGRAYNEAMALLPDGAWGLLIDHDMMWTTREWYRQFQEAAATVPEAGVITVMANRIGAFWQQIGNRGEHDIRVHRQFGTERLKVRTLLDVTDTKGFGGVAMCVSKSAWQQAGGFADGLLCVDHSLHFRLRAIGRRIYMHEGIYCYHWRRAQGDELPTDTPRVPDCPCRGPEPTPTDRLQIRIAETR